MAQDSRIVVELIVQGECPMARSEARRVMKGLERFREVVLDFRGVRELGPSFADEVFRVWATAHPRTKLTPENTIEPVEFMVKRALKAKGS
jgi:hypothetical protein